MIYKNLFTKKEKAKIRFNRALLEKMFSAKKSELILSYITEFPHDSDEDLDPKYYLQKQIEFLKEVLKEDIPFVPILKVFFMDCIVFFLILKCIASRIIFGQNILIKII